MSVPNNRREARRWIREHWAKMIEQSDFCGIGEDHRSGSQHSVHVFDLWSGECEKIAERLRK